MTTKADMEIKTVVAAHSLKGRELNLTYSVFKNDEEKKIAVIENGGKRPADNRSVKVVIDDESLIIQALSDPQSLIVKCQRLDRLSLNSNGQKKMKDAYRLSEFFQERTGKAKAAGIPIDLQKAILVYRSVFKACKMEAVAIMAAKEKEPNFEALVQEWGVELPKG